VVGAGAFAGVAAVEQELGAGGEAELGAGQLGNGLAEGSEVRGLLDAGEGEVGMVGTVFDGKTEGGQGFVERGGELEESVRGFNAGVENARVVGVGIPAKAPDGKLERTGAGGAGQSGLEFVEAFSGPGAEELRSDVKIAGRAPVQGREWPQVFEHKFQIAAHRVFEGETGEEP
jgi:hypothetical protein